MQYPTFKGMHKRRGLTLIELLIVVAIIGLLASIILANVSSSRVKARDARRIGDIKQIQEALDLYSAEHGFRYPGNLNCLVPKYLTSVPTDPLGNTSYSYAGVPGGICNADCTGSGAIDFHLGATLEQSNSSVLSNDSDAASESTCTGSTQNFSGADNAKCNAADAGTSCYDIHT